MKKKLSSKGKSGQVGPRIVRAWFDTVINPLLEWLDREQQLLTEKNWTWRFRPGTLEAIREVRTYVERDAWPNLEQFELLHPEVTRAGDAHDKQVLALRKNCQRLHGALRASNDFQSVFRRGTSTESLRDLGKELRDLFGAYPESDYLDLVAEYVVNSTKALPSYYTIAPLWNRHRDEFLQILERPTILSYWRAASEAGDAAFHDSQRLRQLLKEARLKLSLEHDVPYVVSGERLPSG